MNNIDQKSDWYIPPDWLFHIGCLLMLPLDFVLVLLGLSVLARASRGDLTLFILSLALSCTGVVLLFFARLPLYRQRIFFTIGPAALPQTHKRIYRLAWSFIATAALIMLLMNVLTRL